MANPKRIKKNQFISKSNVKNKTKIYTQNGSMKALTPTKNIKISKQ